MSKMHESERSFAVVKMGLHYYLCRSNACRQMPPSKALLSEWHSWRQKHTN